MSAAAETYPTTGQMNAGFRDYYQCPESFPAFTPAGKLSESSGYFRLGSGLICYGRSSSAFLKKEPVGELYDVEKDIVAHGYGLQLPFDPSETIANLRYERYASNSPGYKKSPAAESALRSAYYLARPLLPVSVRKHLQRARLQGWKNIPFPQWPVDASVERTFEKLLAILLRACSIDYMPFVWFWPDGLPSCAMMTHDVETSSGRDFCSQLMDLDDAHGIKSSFQIVPEKRYGVPDGFIDGIWVRGFEVNVHDLDHDGRLVSDRRVFRQRAQRINQYGRAYRAAGFRSGALYRALDWWKDLDFDYDMSVPSVGHLEAQQGGCCSVTPFFVGHTLELPVTATQDYSLFHILKDFSIDLWVRQIECISERHGLVSFIVHPDYILQRQPRETYTHLLAYLAGLRDAGTIWMALPREVNDWWRLRARMRLIDSRDGWIIEGEGRERARLAYATLQGDQLVYTLEPSRPSRAEGAEASRSGNHAAVAGRLS